MKKCTYALAIASLLLPQVASAQDAQSGRPDEGTSWKYFYFHNANVSEEQARADMVQCYGYSQGLAVMEAGSSPTYASVPYGGTNGLSPAAAGLAAGVGALAGAVIVGFMNAGQRRAMARTNLRKCFGFKGYSRYELTKDEHQQLHDGEGEVVRLRLVERATGPTPEAERLVR